MLYNKALQHECSIDRGSDIPMRHTYEWILVMTQANTHIVIMRERFYTIFTLTTMKTKACQIPFRSIVECFHMQVNAKQLYYCIFLYVVLLWAMIMIMIVARRSCCLFWLHGYHQMRICLSKTARVHPIDSNRACVELSTPFWIFTALIFLSQYFSIKNRMNE